MGIGVSDQAKILFVKSATSAEMSAPQELCSLFDVEVARLWRWLLQKLPSDTPTAIFERAWALRFPSGTCLAIATCTAVALLELHQEALEVSLLMKVDELLA